MTQTAELEGPGRFITRPNCGEAVVGFGGFPSGFWFALVMTGLLCGVVVVVCCCCVLLSLLASSVLVLPFWNRNFYSVILC